MNQLIAFALVSLDGFINDKNGKIDWHTPDEETHQFMNDLHARFTDHIYNEASFEIMKYWENPPNLDSEPQVIQEYTHLWQKTHKTVISKQLSGLDPAQYTVWPDLTAEALSGLKKNTSGNILIGGPKLIAKALDFRLLDKIDLMTVPVLLGGGESLFREVPRTKLKLIETRSFSNGWIYTEYEIQ